MARYDSEHKASTRQRIMERAAERFKTDGIAGSGVAQLMADAGLTNGAFYTHFASKNDLVTQVIAEQMDGEKRRFPLVDGTDAEVEAQMRVYLSQGHRDHRAQGCTTAALAEDIVRAGEDTRQAYTDGLIRSMEGLAARFDGVGPEAAKARALGVFSILVGTLHTARAVSDPELSDAILKEGLRNAMNAIRTGRDGAVAE